MGWAEIPGTTVLMRECHRKAKGSLQAVAMRRRTSRGTRSEGRGPRKAGGACRRVCLDIRFPHLPVSRLLRWQRYTHTRRSDLLPGYGRHHHQIHEVMNEAIPVADHVPMGSVQIGFTLREARKEVRLTHDSNTSVEDQTCITGKIKQSSLALACYNESALHLTK